MKNLSVLLFSATCLLIGSIATAQNPTIDAPHHRTADPSARLGADGKLYVYVTYPNQDGPLTTCHVFSSQDLVNWTDHDLKLNVENIPWASGNVSAPDAMEKEGRYYFYYTATDKAGKNHIGVAAGNSPTGPFTNTSNKPLLENASDPSLFKGDDGQYYLYSGVKVAKLGSDMTSFAETPRTIKLEGRKVPVNPKGVFVYKNNEIFYWTIVEDANTITYWTGNNPYGPFTYGGILMDAYGKDNQHSIVDYHHRQLIFYHRWMKVGDNTLPAQGRRVCADEIRFNMDGSIQKVNSTNTGINFKEFFPPRYNMKDLWYEDEVYAGYLFIHMTSGDYGKMYYALSKDGLHFSRINKGKRIHEEYYGHSGVTKGHDGRYYLSGGQGTNVFWVTSDFVKWEKYSELTTNAFDTPNLKPFRNGAGVAKVFYDTKTSLYMITMQTSLYPIRREGFPHPLEDERFWGGQRAIFLTSKDLKTFSDPRVLLPNFDSGQLDIFVTRIGEKYYTIFKDERYPSYEWTTGKTIRVASSDNLTSGYSDPGPSISPNFSEAPCLVPRLDRTGYYMYYERYQGNGYEIATAPRLEGPWFDVYKEEYNFPEDSRHGWIHPVTQKQWDAIVAAYGYEEKKE